MTSPYGGGFGAYQPGGGLGAGTPLGGAGAPGSLLGGDRYGGTPMTGGQGAMGSAGRYGGSLLAGGGGYQGGGLGAGGSATLAGSGHDHGSYGDLRAAPGSGIGRHQQPFAPMLFSSPGASAGLGGRGDGRDFVSSPAHAGAQGPAPGRTGTAGYFTGGGGGGPAQGTPGSHHAGVSRSFFGANTAGGDVTPASGRRVFGSNRENQPRTSDGAAGGGATNTGGSLRSGAGGKSTALDSGHVGTPWGDKGKTLGGGPSPVRGLNMFGNEPGASGDEFGMNDADGSPNEAWVTVFGFPPGSLAAVLEAFQRDGDVVTHDSFASSPGANSSGATNKNESGPNWVHVRFATSAGAARALRRNGTKVSGVMVGVRRLDDDARAVVEREHGGAGLLAQSSGDRTTLGQDGRRIVRPVAGMSAPGARPSRFQPSREGVALQPRRSVWNNIVEIVFGL